MLQWSSRISSMKSISTPRLPTSASVKHRYERGRYKLLLPSLASWAPWSDVHIGRFYVAAHYLFISMNFQKKNRKLTRHERICLSQVSMVPIHVPASPSLGCRAASRHKTNDFAIQHDGSISVITETAVSDCYNVHINCYWCLSNFPDANAKMIWQSVCSSYPSPIRLCACCVSIVRFRHIIIHRIKWLPLPEMCWNQFSMSKAWL